MFNSILVVFGLCATCASVIPHLTYNRLTNKLATETTWRNWMGNTAIFWLNSLDSRSNALLTRLTRIQCNSTDKKILRINSFHFISLLIVNNVKRLALALITDHSIMITIIRNNNKNKSRSNCGEQLHFDSLFFVAQLTVSRDGQIRYSLFIEVMSVKAEYAFRRHNLIAYGFFSPFLHPLHVDFFLARNSMPNRTK